MLYKGSTDTLDDDRELKDVWRADSYYKNVKEATVWDDTPMDVWLSPLMGDGAYIYTESEQEAKEYLCQAIVGEIEELESILDLLREGF